MSKPKVILLIVFIWLVASAVYAYYYIFSILNSGEQYDAYAMSWQFQLLMFSLVRLPLLVIALLLLIALVVVLPGSLLKSPNPNP